MVVVPGVPTQLRTNYLWLGEVVLEDSLLIAGIWQEPGVREREYHCIANLNAS